MTFIFTVPFGIVMTEEPAACTFKGLPTSVRPVPCHCVFDCKPLPTTIPPEVDCLPAPPITGRPLAPLITGLRFGRNGYFFGNVSARCIISRIYSLEAIDCNLGSLCCCCWLCFEAVVDRVAWDEPLCPPPSFIASLRNSSTAWPTTLFIL